MNLTLPLLLAAACAAGFALVGGGAKPAAQAFVTFALAWMALAAWWRKQAALLREAGRDDAAGLMPAGAWLGRLREEMARARRYQQPLSVLVLRLHLEEELEGRHGQGSSEALGMAAARCLRASTRSMDLPGRLADGRLCLALPATDAAGARKAAAKLLRDLGRQKVKLPDNSVLGGIPAWVGGAQAQEGPETLQKLLNRAGQAMTQAAERGRNQAVVL